MTSFRSSVILLALIVVAHSASGQGSSATGARMTPEERNAAQAKLNRQAAMLDKQKLDGPKLQLRDAMILVRDSLDAAAATAALITRAQATRSSGVELSQARELRGRCAASQRAAAMTLSRIVELHTPDAKGQKLLESYRAAVTEAGRLMGECSKALTAATPVSAKILAAVTLVNNAATRHVSAFSDLASGMEINVRP